MALASEDSDLSSGKVPLKHKTVPKRLPYLEAYYPATPLLTKSRWTNTFRADMDSMEPKPRG